MARSPGPAAGGDWPPECAEYEGLPQAGARLARGTGRWWVVHTRARHEKYIAEKLTEQNVRHYLPLVQVNHTYSKRRATFLVPLFPGYLFLFGEHDDCDKAWKTHRVANVLEVVDQQRLRAELGHIQRAVAGGRAVELYPGLQTGKRYRIARGALQGVEGVLVRQGGRCRMHLNVAALGQSAMLEVDAGLLEAV